MRICCIQFSHINLQNDIQRVNTLLEQHHITQEHDIDLLIFPEASFSPYLFKSPQDALHRGAYISETIVLEFLKQKATQLKCGIIAGLVVVSREDQNPDNVYVIISPTGEEIVRRPKIFPYPGSDILWQRKTTTKTQFEPVQLPWLNNLKIMIGVCNDINCQDPNGEDWYDYPLATASLQHQVQVVILIAAWCSQHPTASAKEHDAKVTSNQQLDYWIDRLQPLMGKKVHFICSDRIGREVIPFHKESDAMLRYCGTSCVLDLCTRNVISALNPEEENCLIVEI
jgi:predicted amidohydrolase